MITLTPQLRTVNKSKSDKNKPFLVLIKRPKKIKLSMLLIANTKIIANSFFVILCSMFRLTDFFVNSSIVSFVFFICKKWYSLKQCRAQPEFGGSGSEMGRSLISFYQSLAITPSTSGFDKLSTALLLTYQ
jgi:predicted neutral ceramidase superfamily lipid hydrolase